MPICTVMVGLPALGKSTRVRELTTMNPDAFVYSTDNLIEEWAKGQGWTYDFAFAKYIDKATSEMNLLLDTAIRERMDIIWDQTNLGSGKRSRIINRMRQNGYDVYCECVLPPEDGRIDDLREWQRRLDNRTGKTIPAHVFDNMCSTFVEPTLNEGFDDISFWDIRGTLTRVETKEN